MIEKALHLQRESLANEEPNPKKCKMHSWMANCGGIKKIFGSQTPRRWGWGIPLKKRAATRTELIFPTSGSTSSGTSHYSEQFPNVGENPMKNGRWRGHVGSRQQ